MRGRRRDGARSAAQSFTFGELAEEAAGRSPPGQPQLRQDQKSRLDRPAAAAARRAGQGQRKPAVRRRRAPARHAVRVGADGAAGRAPPVLVARCPAEGAGSAQRHRARHLVRGGCRQLVGGRAGDQGRQSHVQRHDRRQQHSGPCSTKRWPPARREEWFARGDYDAVTRNARALAATYYVAPSQHLGLEPLTATARVTNGAVEVWAPTQAPGFAASDATLYPMPVGEPAGRALESDAVPTRDRACPRAEAPGAGHPAAIVEPESRPALAGRAGADDGSAGSRRNHFRLANARGDGRWAGIGAGKAGRR